MKTNRLLSFSLGILFLFPLFALGASPVYTESQRILTGLKKTIYNHHPYVDEEKGIFEFDCSAFADYVLGRSYPKSATELEATTQPKRPLAKNFVSFFDALEAGDGNHWQRISYIRHLKRGDLVAWLIPPGSTSKDTGHVMIVSRSPTKNPDAENEFLVSVTDAAVSGHGPNDPRREQGPKGVGNGVIGLIADGKGKPIGFRWSGGKSPKVRYPTIRMARALAESP